jgi:Glycosyltransferase GT-D fold
VKVLDELETMRRVAKGSLSLSRLGRCELRLIQGHHALAQAHHPKLARMLRRILTKGTFGPSLVCVPRIFAAMPPGKEPWYGEFVKAPRLFTNHTYEYGSTFVSRRDAWVGMVDEPAYWQCVRGLWQDRPVLLVAGSDKGLVAKDSGFLGNAASVQVLQSVARDAWSDRDRILDECLRWVDIAPGQDPLVYLSLGATATVLAHDLTMCGIQALDMGHMAQSWLHVGKQAA